LLASTHGAKPPIPDDPSRAEEEVEKISAGIDPTAAFCRSLLDAHVTLQHPAGNCACSHQ
jgi:hypothetical protein